MHENVIRLGGVGRLLTCQSVARRHVHAMAAGWTYRILSITRQDALVPLFWRNNARMLARNSLHTCCRQCTRQPHFENETYSQHIITLNPVAVETCKVRDELSLADASKELKSQIAGAKSSRAVLSVLEQEENRALVANNPPVLLFLLEHLVLKQYGELREKLPFKAWLKMDTQAAFAQLNRAQLCPFMKVAASEVYPRKFLVDCIRNCWESLDGGALADALAWLLHLGQDKHDTVLRNMYLKLRCGVAYAEWSDIVTLLFTAKVLGASDFLLYSRILNRIKSDLLQGKLAKNEQEILPFLRAVALCPALFSPQLRDLINKEMNRIFNEEDFFSNTENVTAWVGAAAKHCHNARMSDQIQYERNVLKLQKFTAHLRGQFSVPQMCDIMQNIHQMCPVGAARWLSTADVVRSEESCHRLNVRDLLAVVAYCDLEKSGNGVGDQGSPHESRDHHVPSGERGPAESPELFPYPESYLGNRSLHSHAQECLLLQLKRLPDCGIHPGLLEYQDIFAALSRPDVTPALRRLLGQLVLIGLCAGFDVHTADCEILSFPHRSRTSLMKTRPGLLNRRLCSLSAFLLVNAESELADSVMDRLVSAVPSCDVLSLATLLRGLNRIPSNISFDIKSTMQTKMLYNICFESLEKAMEESKDAATATLTLSELVKVTEDVLQSGHSRGQAVAAQLMDEIERRTQDGGMTFAAEEYVARLCVTSGYYSPALMDKLSDSVTMCEADLEQFQERREDHVLGLCATFGYKPACAEGLVERVKRGYARDRRADRWSDCLRALNKLADIGDFPEGEIEDILSAETQAAIEQYVNNKPNEKDAILSAVGFLNRKVLASQPESGAGWVLRGWRETRNEKEVAKWKQTDEMIYNSLLKLFNHGPFIVRRGRQLYGMSVDFLVAFKENGKAVPIKKNTYTWTGKERKVAVLLFDGQATACNDEDIVLGCHRSRADSLNSLGFRVLFVSRNGWTKENCDQRAAVIESAMRREARDGSVRACLVPF